METHLQEHKKLINDAVKTAMAEMAVQHEQLLRAMEKKYERLASDLSTRMSDLSTQISGLSVQQNQIVAQRDTSTASWGSQFHGNSSSNAVVIDAEIPLYIRVSRPKDGKDKFGWYRADLKEGHVSDVTLIVDEDSRIPPQGITSVFFGSYLYVLGGNRGSDYTDYTDYTADIFSVNTKQPEEGWTMVSPMRCPRAYASAVTVGGKIYVFGGGDCLGEVFDPAANSWDDLPLPHLPFPESADFFCGREGLNFPVQLDSKKERILIKFVQIPYILLYYFKEDGWEILDKYIYRMHSLVVFEDDVLYLLGSSQVFEMLDAINLNDLNSLDVVWSADLELDPKVVKCSRYDHWSVMLHLGKGKFCLAFENVSLWENRSHLLIIEAGRTTDLEIEVSKVYCQCLHVDLDVVPKIRYYLTP